MAKTPKLLIIFSGFFLLLISVVKIAETVNREPLLGSVNRQWHLKSAPEGTRTEPFEFLVTFNGWGNGEKLEVFYKIKDNSISGKMTKTAPKKYKAEVDIESLSPGTYSIYAYSLIKNKREESPEIVFYVSEPVCVSWTMDWEGWQVPELYLKSIESQFNDHKNIPITHFFSPRIYLDSVMEATQSAYLTDWVKRRADLYGDEIHLHMHMHLDLVQEAGLEPKLWPRWWLTTDEPGEGYDVFTTAYSYEEFSRLLLWAKKQFEKNGLPGPIGYRAGGWFADSEILRALQDNGFKFDASGREKKIWDQEEFESPWDLTSTSQPYFPSLFDQNLAGDPHFGLLEIPNNGGDCFAYSAQELKQRFFDNFNSQPIPIKKAVTFLSHPQWQKHDQLIIEEVLNTTDEYLYENDKGPVIYTTLGQVYQLWQQKQL